jgi:hypothetical protein
MMPRAAKSFFGSLGCCLLLAVFFFSVTGHPLVHAVVPHDDCQVCAALSNRLAPAEPAPELAVTFVEFGATAGPAVLPPRRVEQPVPSGRGPPAS